MALGMVQAGYGNSLCAYSLHFRVESDMTYTELLAELTTELELAFRDESEEPVTEDGTSEDFEQTESHSDRKKEWENLLKESIVLEAMLRQMLENGLGQQKDKQQKPLKKRDDEELDNDFELAGVPADLEGKQKKPQQDTNYHGNSEYLQSRMGNGSEYFSPSAAGRQRPKLRIFCLTCETDCDQKKQWKITE